MTRAEFAKVLGEYWRTIGLREGETLIGFADRTNDGMPKDYYGIAVADIATNGFDPEPPSHAQVTAALDAVYEKERAGEAAKRSRPFVGSHKLPYDSDYD